MNRGSTDNLSVMIVGLNDPSSVREAKKGNEHIKILSSIGNMGKKKISISNKENSYPEKIKEIDSRIMEINKNTSKLMQQMKRIWLLFCWYSSCYMFKFLRLNWSWNIPVRNIKYTLEKEVNRSEFSFLR